MTQQRTPPPTTSNVQTVTTQVKTTTTTDSKQGTATTEASRCTEALVPIPDGTHLLFVSERRFAVLQCQLGYKFPTNKDGAYFCENNTWTGDIPACIRRSFSALFLFFLLVMVV